MNNKFLLISGEQFDRWGETLSQALASIGPLEITTWEQSGIRLKGESFAVVIIDAARVAEPERLTAELLAQNPHTRVVVATYSPTWSRAKQALQAGAMDYIPKTMIKEELRSRIQAVMLVPSRSAKKFPGDHDEKKSNPDG